MSVGNSRTDDVSSNELGNCVGDGVPLDDEMRGFGEMQGCYASRVEKTFFKDFAYLKKKIYSRKAQFGDLHVDLKKKLLKS